TFIPNGSITSITSGDVITLDDGGYGHAGIIDSYDPATETISIVNQNTVDVRSSAKLSNETISMVGWSGYSVQGIIHADGNDGSGSGAGAGPAVGNSPVSIGFNPSNGLPAAAAQGPYHSLRYYWQDSQGNFHGGLEIAGADSTFSAPSLAYSPTTDLPAIAVEGPNHRLDYYYQQAVTAKWIGPIILS